jgi:hypothetical protein
VSILPTETATPARSALSVVIQKTVYPAAMGNQFARSIKPTQSAVKNTTSSKPKTKHGVNVLGTRMNRTPISGEVIMWPFTDEQKVRDQIKALDAKIEKDKDLFRRCDEALRLLRKRIPELQKRRNRLAAKIQ